MFAEGMHAAGSEHMGYHAQASRPAEAPPSKATGEKGRIESWRADRNDRRWRHESPRNHSSSSLWFLAGPIHGGGGWGL